MQIWFQSSDTGGKTSYPHGREDGCALRGEALGTGCVHARGEVQARRLSQGPQVDFKGGGGRETPGQPKFESVARRIGMAGPALGQVLSLGDDFGKTDYCIRFPPLTQIPQWERKLHRNASQGSNLGSNRTASSMKRSPAVNQSPAVNRGPGPPPLILFLPPRESQRNWYQSERYLSTWLWRGSGSTLLHRHLRPWEGHRDGGMCVFGFS